MVLACGRVLAGESTDEPGWFGGALPAAGAQRTPPEHRELGGEGDPQLRAGGSGRPRGPGPVGVVDLTVSHPGAGRGRRERWRGRHRGLASPGWGLDAAADLGPAWGRGGDPPGRGRAAPGW